MNIGKAVVLVALTALLVSCKGRMEQVTISPETVPLPPPYESEFPDMLNFRHIGIQEGLPDNYIKRIFGLPDGRIGIRTTVLLSFYDGQKFMNYSLEQEGYAIDYSVIIPTQYVDGSQRIWLKEKGRLNVFDLKTNKFIEPNDIFSKWGLSKKVRNLFVDEALDIWLVDEDYTICRWDDDGESLLEVCSIRNFIAEYGSVKTLTAQGDRFHVLFDNGVLSCYDLKHRTFVYHDDFLRDRINEHSIAEIRMLENDSFWLMWNGGLIHNNGDGLWTGVTGIDYQACGTLGCMDLDEAGNVWLGTAQQGAFRINRRTMTAMPVRTSFSNELNKNDMYIHGLHYSRQTGILWLGFFNRGIACWHPSMNNCISLSSDNPMGKKDVRSLLEVENNRIWMGTDDGLFTYDLETDGWERIYPQLKNRSVRPLYRDREDRIWIGTYREGLFCLENGSLKTYFTSEEDDRRGYNNILAITEDVSGNIWLSTVGGVGQINVMTGQLELLCDSFPGLESYERANTMIVDDRNRLLVGTNNGMYGYDIDEQKIFLPFQSESKEMHRLDEIKFNVLYIDRRGMLWCGTQTGIWILSENSMAHLDEEDGLDNAVVQTIQEDEKGNIWISTIGSVYKVIVYEENDTCYYEILGVDQHNNLYWNEMYSFCSLKQRNGQFCFGKTNGITVINPQTVSFVSLDEIFFSSFSLFNVPVDCGMSYRGRVLFQESVNRQRFVELEYDENFLTLGFSALNYVTPSQTFFRYRLQGMERTWTELNVADSGTKVTYNALPPGEYEFVLQAAGTDRQWGPPSSFHIIIHPPFYWTLWAKIFYMLVLLGCLYGFYLYLQYKNNRKFMRMASEESARQKEELNQMKFRFFINVSHELRTPLTLIITPLEVLMKKMNDEAVRSQLDVIYKNAKVLYGLVNQLLDFRKVELKMEKLHLAFGDMEEFVLTVYNAFLPLVKNGKNLELVYQSKGESIWMYFDRDKLYKILNNLLSNAIKFTPNGGCIYVNLSKVNKEGRIYARISIADTGIGISEEHIINIFDRFYQIEDNDNNDIQQIGSGIGLHLVKDYVQLHQGEIDVESVPGNGSVFTVLIPADLKIDKKDLIEPERKHEPEMLMQEEVLKMDEGIKKSILIVDDNTDFRHFLCGQLENYYKVWEAVNGEEAELIAKEKNPDLIISDIMMPKVDGLELCNRIKSCVDTSHIPVVLLTARTSDDIRVSGYKVGADSYIAKPFNFDMLHVRIKNLLEQQEKRKREFQKNLDVNPKSISITSVDEQFLQKAMELMEKHMDNPEYGVEALSDDLAMSRMSLYRKLHSITGYKPTEFIRSIRLKRAAQYLKESQLSVAEIADKVGFNSSSYFSRCFKDEFGVLPTQYAEQS